MRIARDTFVGILLASILVLGGCKKKKPAVPPAQSQAPTITQPQPQPETQPAPPASSEPTRPETEKQPETTVATPTSPAPKPKPKTRATKPKPPAPTPEKPAEKAAENKQPTKTVVPEGGAQPATPQLSPAVSNDQTVQQRQNTNQLLESTDYNLKNITRPLNTDEQAIVQHIRSYIQQSRDATRDGDTERAYNLALKAHLLCDELIKR
jgi:outer membrane biosynthesis protein TonB